MILNLLVAGGVGYIIMGQKTKGIVAIVVWLVGLVACGIPSGLVACRECSCLRGRKITSPACTGWPPVFLMTSTYRTSDCSLSIRIRRVTRFLDF